MATFICAMIGFFQLLITVHLYISVNGAICSSNVGMTIEGNISIGGIFPLHERSEVFSTSWTSGPPKEKCVDFHPPYFMAAAAARFAVKEIREKKYIDLGFELGYVEQEFCNSPVSAASATLNLISNANVKAIVSGALSSSMITIGPIVAHHAIATVATWATSERLTDSNIYRTLFRTVPGDQSQSLLLAEIAKYFEWEWVGAVGTDDAYGRDGLRMFINKLKERNICVAFETYLQVTGGKDEMDLFLNQLNDSSVDVIFFFSTVDLDFRYFFQKADDIGISPRLWIASDGWADRAGQFYEYKSVASVLGVTIADKPLPDMLVHLADYTRIQQSSRKSFRENFEEWICEHENLCNDTLCKKNNNQNTIHKIEIAARKYLNKAINYEAYTTYIAVYAIAQALKDIELCEDRKGLLADGKCPSIRNLKRWQLVTYLDNVNFTDNNGSIFNFLENRQIEPSYVVLNSKKNNRIVEMVKVGSYKHKELKIFDNLSIYWGTGTKPLAICNANCKPGTRRHYIENEQTCCFKCIECSGNTISNTQNADKCEVCGNDKYADVNRTTCLKKIPDVFLWGEIISVIFCLISVVGSLATVVVTCIFYRHRETPVVKASSLSHSFVLAFVLLLSFQMVYFYIGIPTDNMCKVLSVLDGLNLTIILGIFCAKLYVIVKIFNNKQRFKIPIATFYRYSWILVVVITAIHLAFKIIHETIYPSHAVRDYNNSLTIIPVFCRETDVDKNTKECLSKNIRERRNNKTNKRTRTYECNSTPSGGDTVQFVRQTTLWSAVAKKQRPKTKHHPRRKINVKKIRDTGKCAKFEHQLANNLAIQDDCKNIKEYWGKKKTAIYDSAIQVFGKKIKNNKDWFEEKSEKLLPVIEKKRTALLAYKTHATRHNLASLRLARAVVQRVLGGT
ncbi:extracellular calcium-sensing receptor-like [Antedon mediterranea]|uniref:extracellular calcium-sensing receptor-like n=1 Tax=Antedon mediterranea TaxID=105859 RepID=UPI003AF7B19C